MNHKFAYISLMCLGIMGASASVAAANMPFFLSNPPSTPIPAATAVNIEHPVRCAIQDVGDEKISTTISVRPEDFKMVQFEKTDALPRFEVNGFTFKNLPLDQAVQTLVEEADISVYTDGGFYPEMSAKDVYGELTDVLNEITKVGDAFYTYDAKEKILKMTKTARFELKLPKNKLVMFAVLDAIRGADIETANPDWHDNTIMLTLDQSQKKIIEDLIAEMVKESKLLSLDVEVYQINAPTGSVPWQEVVGTFGAGQFHTQEPGLIGKAFTTGHQRHAAALINLLAQNYEVGKISQGVAIVPHTWKMRFDVGRCSNLAQDLNSLSLLLNTRIQSTDVIETEMTLDTLAGEISSFKTISGLDDEVVIIGIPASVIHPDRGGELLVTLKVKLVRLLSEGK